MKSKTIGLLVAFMVMTTLAWAADYTPLLHWKLTNDAGLNATLTGLDNQVGSRLLQREQSNAIFCGQLVNNSTIYAGPCSTDPGGEVCTIGGTACDALDDATEGTADAPLYTDLPLLVYGMRCKVSSAGSNGVAITLRSAAADTSPALTCTVPTGSVDCQDSVGLSNPVNIAAGATMALESVTTEDLSAEDVRCVVAYSTLDKNN
jgi:hypothetical protein